jgi:hypothetical protein
VFNTMSSLLFSLPLLVSVATFQTASANPASEAGAVVSSLTARGGYVDRTNPCAALRVRRGALDIVNWTPFVGPRVVEFKV